MGTPASRRLVGERTSSGADEFSCLHGNDRAELARTRRRSIAKTKEIQAYEIYGKGIILR